MDTSELLDEFRAIRLLELKHGQWDKEEVSEKEERIEEFIVHLEKHLPRHEWHVKDTAEKSRIYVNKKNPDTFLELTYGTTYPDTRTFYRVELKLKRRRFLFDKVLAEGEMVFSRI